MTPNKYKYQIRYHLVDSGLVPYGNIVTQFFIGTIKEAMEWMHENNREVRIATFTAVGRVEV